MLVTELERCILGYFAFYWSQTDLMINGLLEIKYNKKTGKLIDKNWTRLYLVIFQNASFSIDVGEYFSNHSASLEEKIEYDAIQKAEESSESENNSDESSDDETSKLKLLQKVGDGLIPFYLRS
uniref:P-loop containing nucleoside triphosphate hydrolases superfamily protein n=1 Tax=Tanacetum cinerariifolium TaxID=118510 RepID=A0A699HJU9_TANCI|nr:P-loop containing nucleoside triphosphate hydrolases superfamily protein [Tanacetum cinerariifolium]